jgi:hypothetical protein
MEENQKKRVVLIFNDKDYKLEIESNTTITTLKKLAKTMLNLEKNSFKLTYNDKNLLDSEGSKLYEIFSENKEIKVHVIAIKERRNNRSKSDKKLKYMLECSLHTNENAHFYCFTCKVSFCTVCGVNHKAHDLIDKYIYCKNSDELVHSVMDDIVVCVNQYEEEMKVFEKENIFSSNIDCQTKQIKDLFEIISEENQFNLKEKSLRKINNFKEDFLNFKTSCLSALNETKSKKLSDLVILEDDYFLNLHKTIQNFNTSKHKLIDYIKQIKKEHHEERNEFNTIGEEIRKDLNAVIDKLQIKLRNISLNKNKSEKIIQSLSSQMSTIRINSENLNIPKLIMKRRIGKNEVIIYDFLLKSFEKRRSRPICNDNISALISDRASTNYDRNSQFSDITSQYSQISHVPSTNNIITSCANVNSVNVESNEKVLNRKKSSFVNSERFLPFSVYLNVDNKLFVSGGKKNDECVKDFLIYSPDKNSMGKLESMKNSRCSHAMAFVPPHDIYVVGGYCNNTSEKYSINEKKWRNLANLNFKERQVPTLILVNYRYLYCLLGYINTNINDTSDYIERFDTYNIFSNWELFKINNPKNIEMKIFNAGCVLLNDNQILVCGGERYQGNEIDKCFIFSFNNFEASVSDLILPQPTSFLEKLFIPCGKGKSCQFEMKKNNLFIFNQNKKTFKVKQYT